MLTLKNVSSQLPEVAPQICSPVAATTCTQHTPMHTHAHAHTLRYFGTERVGRASHVLGRKQHVQQIIRPQPKRAVYQLSGALRTAEPHSRVHTSEGGRKRRAHTKTTTKKKLTEKTAKHTPHSTEIGTHVGGGVRQHSVHRDVEVLVVPAGSRDQQHERAHAHTHKHGYARTSTRIATA
jgi:hypothetical protein